MSGHAFSRLTAVALPLLRDNVNTDAIIPSREMKTVSRRGLADGLFADWRYTQVGGRVPDPAFILNNARFAGAQILLAGANFGCGSSREHAAWALVEFGFRAILAESFNPIFRGNAVLNGIVPIVLAKEQIATFANEVMVEPEACRLTVDLDAAQVSAPSGSLAAIELDEESMEMLRGGLDAIDLTLKHIDRINTFRQADHFARPWAYC